MTACGFEVLPGTFIQKAQATANVLHLKHVTFQQTDLRTADISGGTIYLIVWTTFPEPLTELADPPSLEALLGRTGVITLTQPVRSAWYERKGSETLPFSWGSGTVYYQERKP